MRLVNNILDEHPGADATSIADAAMVSVSPDFRPALGLAIWLIAGEALQKRALLSGAAR